MGAESRAISKNSIDFVCVFFFQVSANFPLIFLGRFEMSFSALSMTDIVAKDSFDVICVCIAGEGGIIDFKHV